MSNSDHEVDIDIDCSLKKSNLKLLIQVDLSSHASSYRTLFFMFFLFAIFSLFFLIFFGEVNAGLIVFFIWTLFSIFPLISCIYFAIQKQTWSFDKPSQLITFIKYFSHVRKKIKTFNFSEIELLRYQLDQRYTHSIFYNLELVFKKNKKKIRVYRGQRSACKNLGTIISNFMDKTLIFRPRKVIF